MQFDPRKDSLYEFIWVGDPHVKKGNLEESERLMAWVDLEAQKRGLPVILAGDQYNDFGIARVEAVHFWFKTFEKMKSKVIAIVGNHDANSDMSHNFMDVHQDQVWVVDRPYLFNNFESDPPNAAVGLMPFYRSNDLFVKEMNELASKGARRLFCHQEFNGCQYENGFYSPNGVDPGLIPDSIINVIAGHIHKQQEFGKVWYPGTARQLTRSDIGEIKGIWHVDLKTGSRTLIPTPVEVSEPFMVVNITPGHNIDLSQLSSPRIYVNISGPSKFVKDTLKKMPEGAKVRSMPESESVTSEIKESEGIPKAFFNFSMEYANQNSLGNTEIKMILNKIYDKCPILKGV